MTDLLFALAVGGAAYLVYKKFNTIEAGLQENQERFNKYVANKEEEAQEAAIPPAKKYLKITPEVTFTEITGNEWTGKMTWIIKNTSSNYTFNITRIKSNISICGYTSLFVPGNKSSIVRVDPNTTVTIVSTWQDKRWFAGDNVAAKDEIREILRSQLSTKVPCVEADIVVWCRGVGQVEETKYEFPNVKGTAYLTSGAKYYWGNQGENAANWND